MSSPAALDEVFKALADVHRRRLLDRLNARNGQSLHELCAGLDLTRQSVSRHLAVLEAAGLVRTARRGREKLHHLDVAPLGAITERWIDRYGRAPARPGYTAYIGTTPECLWRALTEPDLLGRYWPGVPPDPGDRAVLLAEPYRRLSWGRPGKRVSFDITPRAPGVRVVRLVVSHEGFDAGCWPEAVARLKTLLENGGAG